MIDKTYISVHLVLPLYPRGKLGQTRVFGFGFVGLDLHILCSAPTAYSTEDFRYSEDKERFFFGGRVCGHRVWI